MKNQIYILVCLAMVACNSRPQGNAQAASTPNTVMAPSHSEPFDLARLSLNENLLNLMAAQGVKPEPKDSLDKTMLGFEVFRSSNRKVLRFENTDLSGSNGKNKNHVLFHYNEEKKTLACYEIKLYNQDQTDTLISLVGKVGTLIFKRTKLPKGAIELDVNGDEVKPQNSVRKTYRVWENKSTGLSYFLIETGTGKNLTAELIVLKRATQFGKDWISVLQLDWYKNDKSEPL
jgi:hypothetical protein